MNMNQRFSSTPRTPNYMIFTIPDGVTTSMKHSPLIAHWPSKTEGAFRLRLHPLQPQRFGDLISPDPRVGDLRSNVNLFSKKEKLDSIFLMVVLILFFLVTATLIGIAVNYFLPGWNFTDLKK